MVLAGVAAVVSIALFVVGTSGGFSGHGDSTHGEGGTGYFVAAMAAMLLAGVFTWLGLATKTDADR